MSPIFYKYSKGDKIGDKKLEKNGIIGSIPSESLFENPCQSALKQGNRLLRRFLSNPKVIRLVIETLLIIK